MSVEGGRPDTGNYSGQSIDVVDVRLLCPARDADESPPISPSTADRAV